MNKISKPRAVAVAVSLGLGAVMSVAAAAPASADTTTMVTSPIKAGSDAVTVGQATFTRTEAANGNTTVVVRGVTTDAISESHLCYGTQPYTSRVSPGPCGLTGSPTGNTVEYTVSIPASNADRTYYFQFHVVTKADTAYAGWQPGSPFFGNVGVASPDAGTELPMGSLGGVLLAGGAAVALLVTTRRRRVAGQFTRN